MLARFLRAVAPHAEYSCNRQFLVLPLYLVDVCLSVPLRISCRPFAGCIGMFDRICVDYGAHQQPNVRGELAVSGKPTGLSTNVRRLATRAPDWGKWPPTEAYASAFLGYVPQGLGDIAPCVVGGTKEQ